MRYVLTIPLLLLLASSGWAGFSEIVIGEHGEILDAVPLDMNGKPYTMETRRCIARGHGVDICTAAFQDDPCLAQMAAAMRAMEPFSIVGNVPYLDTLHFEAQGGMVLTIIEPMQGDGVKALKLWDAAKRDCWRTP